MSTHKDPAGNTYNGPGNGPAHAGSKITIQTANGPKQGTMGNGGYVIPNK